MMQQLRARKLSALDALATLTALASSPPRASLNECEFFRRRRLTFQLFVMFR